MIAKPLLFALLPALLLAPACDLINGPSELERKIAAEQQVIAAYSAEVPKVDQRQQAFLEAWTRAHTLKDFKAYKEALEVNVLPALDAYVAAAEAMPAGSEELARIHRVMLDALVAAKTSFHAYGAALTEENVEQGYAEVLTRMDAVRAARATYLEQLKTHYAKNRVDLVQDK